MKRRGAAVDRYVCLPVRFWDGLRALGLELTPSPAALWAWLATGPSATRIPGVVTGGPLAIAEAIGWSPEECARCIATLETAGAIVLDARARIVYLPELLAADCSRPASPSTAAMWRRELNTLVACPLRERITDDARAMMTAMGSTWLAAFESGHDPQTGKPRPNKNNQPGNQTGYQPPNQGGRETGDHLSLDLDLSLSPSLAPAPAQTESSPPAPVRFDFEAVYALYPRKGDGKAKGIDRLKAQVRTTERYAEIERAVRHFAAKVRAEGTEAKFVPHFSTWANGKWRDYIDGPHIVAAQSTSAPPPRIKRFGDSQHSDGSICYHDCDKPDCDSYVGQERRAANKKREVGP